MGISVAVCFYLCNNDIVKCEKEREMNTLKEMDKLWTLIIVISIVSIAANIAIIF